MNLKTGLLISMVFIIIFLLAVTIIEFVSPVENAFGYYGVPNTLSYLSFNPPFTNYGLLGTPFYNFLSNPFGFGGIYNLTTSLSGLSIPGFLGGLNNLGGLYGLNAFRGFYGLSGLSGLYPSALPGFGLTSLISPANLLTAGLSNPFFTAEQAGAWIGTWNLGFLTGNMIMNLDESITGSLSGTAQLIGNLTFGGIFNVYGTGDPTFISLNGQDPTLTYAVSLQGILTTSSTMEGFYTIYKIGSVTPKETGTFNLELLI